MSNVSRRRGAGPTATNGSSGSGDGAAGERRAKTAGGGADDARPAGQERRTLLTAAGVVATVLALSAASLFDGPAPLPPTAPPHLFSEGRAAAHVAALAGGSGGGDGAAGSGGRQVGTPGAAAAVSYLTAAGAALADAAAASGGHYTVQTQVQDVTGAVDMRFLGVDFANAWWAVPNVEIKITPAHNRSRPATGFAPALLLAAHYDSTVGSSGASDAAACVAVALEAARALVSRPPPPPEAEGAAPPPARAASARRAAIAAARSSSSHGPASPLILLFNGAEETLMQGAHGFMQSSPWADELGAFINLEATGADGPAAVFQASGSWATSAYAAGAARPRGTVIAQAFFDAGLTPADTDFRVFAARAGGRLPGIDAALILGAEVYHTHADAPGRLRPGTLQAFGEQATGGAAGVAAALAAGWRAVRGEKPVDHRAATTRALGAPGDLGPYYDFLGRALITYSPGTARILHAVPLLVAVPLFVAVPAARGWAGPAEVAAAVGRAALGVSGAVAAPGLLGAAVAALTRRPLAWFASPGSLGLPAYAALSVAGALTPHVFLGGGKGRGGSVAAARTGAAGYAILHAASAAAGGLAGWPASYVLAIWAAAALAACGLPALGCLPDGLAAAAGWSATALITTPNAIALGLHMLQKASFAGSPVVGAGRSAAAAVGDGVPAAAVGGCVAAVVGAGGPWLGRRVGAGAGRAGAVGAASAGLVLLLATAAARGSAPYSPAFPKKLYLQLLHRHGDAVGEGRPAVEWVAAGVDATPLSRALEGPAGRGALHPATASPFASTLAARPGAGLDWMVLYPLGYVLDTAAAAVDGAAVVPAPGPSLAVEGEAPAGGGTTRVSFALTLPPRSPPGLFGALNLTGPLTAWSFTDRNFTANPTDRAGGPGGPEEVGWHVVRLAGTPPSRVLRWWVEVAHRPSSPSARPRVRVEAALASVGAGPAGDALIASLPDWVSVAAATTHVVAGEF